MAADRRRNRPGRRRDPGADRRRRPVAVGLAPAAACRGPRVARGRRARRPAVYWPYGGGVMRQSTRTAVFAVVAAVQGAVFVLTGAPWSALSAVGFGVAAVLSA